MVCETFFWIMLCLIGSLGPALGMEGEKRLQDMAAYSPGMENVILPLDRC